MVAGGRGLSLRYFSLLFLMLKRTGFRGNQKSRGHLDYLLLLGVILVLFFGVVMVYDASVVYATNVFGGKYHFLVLQAGWVAVGLFSLALAANLDYHLLTRIARPLLYLSLFLLFLLAWPNLPFINHFAPKPLYDLFIPQFTDLKAYRWIIINPPPLPILPFFGRFSFQPTDLAKLSLIIFLSFWLSELKEPLRLKRGFPIRPPLSVFYKFLLLFFAVIFLTVYEPDLGTAVILALIMLGLYFFSGAPLYFLFFSLLFFLSGTVLAIINSPYRQERVASFLNHSRTDPLASGYHLQQALIALGSGGLTGLGLGQSRQKYEYLPEAATDSIFAVVGEELGFFGAMFLLLLLFFIIWRSLEISRNAPDKFGRLLAAGVVTWLAGQATINVAAMTNLLPITGVTLPFLSYGGSSLVATLTAVGILLSVSRQAVRRKEK